MEIFYINAHWKVALVFVSCLLSSCYHMPLVDETDLVLYSPLKVTNVVDDLSPYISDITVIPVGSDGIARPGISKILFSDRVYFLCGGVVFSTSPDWDVIEKVGNIGRGPKEYLSIKDIALNAAGNELWCMDVLNSIFRYDLKTLSCLGIIESENLGYNRGIYNRGMVPLEHNHFALYTPNPVEFFPKRNETFYCLNCFDSSGKKINQLLPWTQFNAMASFSNPISIDGSGRYILTPESSNISYVFNDTGIEYQILFDFENKWIPSKFIDPKNGGPGQIGDLFDLNCYKLLSSVYLSEDNLYFHAFGKESTSWNFVLSRDNTKGFRWQSIGMMTPPISAVASNNGYLFFPYDDYGAVENEKDPLKKYIIKKYGLPDNTDTSYLIKVKFDVN